MANVAASVKQRLLNIASVSGEEFEQLLVRYASERMLYRLSVSSHRNAFVLKGALLFVAWEGMPHRATRDIDLLGFGDDSIDRMNRVIWVPAGGSAWLMRSLLNSMRKGGLRLWTRSSHS